MGSVGYGGYPDDQATTALRSTDAQATSMLPPMNPDDGGYGYNNYDDRPARRRQQKKSNTSTILLVVAGVLVLVGAILIGKWMFGGGGVSNNSVTVPNLVSQTQKEAAQLATNAELKVSITKKPCETEKTGNVCSQDPKAGVKATKGDTINLVVSTGAPKVVVPGVTGQSLDDAKAKLTGSDYNFTVKTQTQVSTEDPNTVLDQNPKLGAEVQKGSTITLTIAKAAEKATVPDVTGKSCEEAKAAMTANNLVGNCTQIDVTDPNQANKVVSTVPAIGSSADKNSSVTIQIGKAQNQTFQMPQVTQMTLAQAKQVLAQNNLQLGNVAGSQDDNAIVLTSDPQQGAQVTAGQKVNLIAADSGQNGGNNNGGGNGFFGGLNGG
jgi:serine/threonine-protein kinase